MADKITNFEDYKKRDNAEDIDIQIEDPCIFLTEQEREEYYRERQKEQQTPVVASDTHASDDKETDKNAKDHNNSRKEPRTRPEYDDTEASEDNDEEYDEDYEEDDPEEGENGSSGGFPIELFVRISSAITGILILAILAIVFKAKVYDRYFAKDPDQQQVVVSALPPGFTEKNDTATVTAKSLNLRTVASSESDATIS